MSARKALCAPLLAAAVAIPLAIPSAAAAPVPMPAPVSGATHTTALRGVDVVAARTPVPGAGRTMVLTPAQTTRSFSLVGVSWDDPAASPRLAVTVRTRTAGTWTDWRTLRVGGDGTGMYAEDAPRPATARGATEPLWVGRSDGAQVRVGLLGGELPRGLRLDLVDPGVSAADSRIGPAAQSAPRTASRPAIVGRAEWGADETLRDLTFKYTNTVKAMFVHHTADSNDFTCADSPAVLRSIYRYHVKTNGWADIGYNFLVDRCGTIYEGRAGGVDKPVKGAHTLGFNNDTAAVAAMGTYTGTAPPAALVDGLSRVLAWKLGLHGADPLGKAELTSADSGSKFPAGTGARFNVIAGHRDAFNTECPGQKLYENLWRLRRGAERLMQ
ncbi:peptidoglycan recognition protein family protein [Yinghuangia soli]|uniref:Peptidoglycan recognition protein n=1 Tax=Yinghuangia soli TaxID=2908204 RepID=A0AA41Q730_9ACTN|nr:peptidoglycan recognition protein [Yinghuangia soli]MCF2532688.1 peptidoglycan recognition protein [Yinghuangia soli]